MVDTGRQEEVAVRGGAAQPGRGPGVGVVGVLALLLVATAAAAAVLLHRGPGAAAPGAAETRAVAGSGVGSSVAGRSAASLARPLAGPTRRVAAGGARFAVPRAPGWSVSAPGTLVGFDRAGGALLGSPAFLRRGWCAGERRWSNRALVGVVPPRVGSTRGPARRATRRAATRWREALAGPGASDRGDTDGAPRARRVRLADGTAGWLATGRTPVPDDGAGCAPPAVAFAVLGVPAEGGLTRVVALRDVGVPDALPAAVVRRVLAGVRVAGAA